MRFNEDVSAVLVDVKKPPSYLFDNNLSFKPITGKYDSLKFVHCTAKV
jgi:hypothetical protein